MARKNESPQKAAMREMMSVENLFRYQCIMICVK